jgi:hypothetical protein
MLLATIGKSWSLAKLTEEISNDLVVPGRGYFGNARRPCCSLPKMVPSACLKAVDLAFNSQPESSDHGWNVRDLGNNMVQTNSERCVTRLYELFGWRKIITMAFINFHDL